MILVFDGLPGGRRPGGCGEISQYPCGLHKGSRNRRQYIEKTVHEIGKKHHVTVATSDALEQVIILGQGAARMSARNLQEEIRMMKQEIREYYNRKNRKKAERICLNICRKIWRNLWRMSGWAERK